MTYKARVRLADNLYALMKLKGIKGKELALRSGLRRETISHYLNCTQQPKIESLGSLARALGVNVSEIIAGIEPKEIVMKYGGRIWVK